MRLSYTIACYVVFSIGIANSAYFAEAKEAKGGLEALEIEEIEVDHRNERSFDYQLLLPHIGEEKRCPCDIRKICQQGGVAFHEANIWCASWMNSDKWTHDDCKSCLRTRQWSKRCQERYLACLRGSKECIESGTKQCACCDRCTEPVTCVCCAGYYVALCAPCICCWCLHQNCCVKVEGGSMHGIK